MRRSVLPWVVLIALVATALAAVPALAQGTCIDPGNKIPVVFVHGLLGDEKAWTDSNGDGYQLFTRVSSMDGFVADTFDYGPVADKWVEHPEIGPKLAKRIVCLSDALQRNTGVPGKVVLVGHSMGGLAIRYAVAQPGVGERVGLVVTIGTPHNGSQMADMGYFGSADPAFGVVARPAERLFWWIMCVKYCGLLPLLRYADAAATPAMVQGSAELARLPAFPRSLPVMTIAADIHVTIPWWIPSDAHEFSMGDVVVGVESATAPAAHRESGGGATKVACQASITDLRDIADLRDALPCFHIGVHAGGVDDPGLLGNPKTIDAVLGSLERWSDAGAGQPVDMPAALSDYGVTFGDVTVFMPETLRGCATAIEPCVLDVAGDPIFGAASAFIGTAGSGGYFGLLLYTNFTGSLDDLAPSALLNEQCSDTHGDGRSTEVTARVVDIGEAPVAGELGEFRLWELTCREGGRRILLWGWADPSHGIAFVETYHDPNHEIMVATARIDNPPQPSPSEGPEDELRVRNLVVDVLNESYNGSGWHDEFDTTVRLTWSDIYQTEGEWTVAVQKVYSCDDPVRQGIVFWSDLRPNSTSYTETYPEGRRNP